MNLCGDHSWRQNYLSEKQKINNQNDKRMNDDNRKIGRKHKAKHIYQFDE